MERGPGPVYTRGQSFRARAEDRQRQYRMQTLKAGYSTWGHWLDDEAAGTGANFVVPEAFEVAKERQRRRKGVAERTFTNMLSSQAMCFNLFAPLKLDPSLALAVFRHFLPSMTAVSCVEIEHTPHNDIFGDQSGRGGVDCDVLVEAALDGAPTVIVLETKLVEEEFSTCGFRKPGRARKQQVVCPLDVRLHGDFGRCLYTSAKGYHYWQRTRESGNVRLDSLPATGCAFSGPAWQLWVNHTLACVEASRRQATGSLFGVCAPAANDALLDQGQTLERFRSHLASPASLLFLDLDHLIEVIREEGEGKSAWHDQWWKGLKERYAAI